MKKNERKEGVGGKLSGRKRNRMKKMELWTNKRKKMRRTETAAILKNKWENKAISSKIVTTTKCTKNVILYVCVLTLIDFWISSRSMCLWEYADAGIDP